MYAGPAEASLVPPGWYGWLHHTTDELPGESNPTYAWQRPHRSNPTGTEKAEFPPGHYFSARPRPPVQAEYRPWTPAQASTTKQDPEEDSSARLGAGHK